MVSRALERQHIATHTYTCRLAKQRCGTQFVQLRHISWTHGRVVLFWSHLSIDKYLKGVEIRQARSHEHHKLMHYLKPDLK